jgi:hypothetical protein
LSRTLDLHCLSKRAAHAKIHLDLTLGGTFAARPELQLFGLRPVTEHNGARRVENSGDLDTISV